jgi:hypothetical protein
MEPILDKAKASQNLLEKIASAIPGFKGYREREMRRDADHAQREHLAQRLEQNKSTLNDIALRATRAGVLDLINDVETARKRLDKLVARVRYADRGYSGFFDAIKVDEGMLARVYEFDLNLIEDVDAVQVAAKQAAGASASDTKSTLDALTARINEADTHLNEREEILSGIK